VNNNFSITDANSAWFKANSGTSSNWVYNESALESAVVSSYTYIVQYRGRDKSNPANIGPSSNGSDSNFTVGKDSISFIVDKVAPVSRITSILNEAKLNSLSTISGTALDSIAGISNKNQIELSICEVEPGNGCWNGVVPGTFSVVGETFYNLNNDASLNGSYIGGVWSINAPALRDGYKYIAKVRARDNAVPANVETLISSVTFRYDTTPPQIGIIKPINNRYYGANISSAAYYLESIYGTASDSFGVSKVEISAV